MYNQQQTINGTNKYFTAQTDYTLPIHGKVEIRNRSARLLSATCTA